MKLHLICAAAAFAGLSLGHLPEAEAQAEPYVGQLMATAGDFCPRGWVNANGQIIAISQNDALFSLYGTTYGGNGTTTFGLPDLRGRMAAQAGHGPGLTERTQGSMFGADDVTLTVSQLAAHNHAMYSSSASPDQTEIQGGTLATFPPSVQAYAVAQPNQLTQPLNNRTIGTAGASYPVAVQQPYTVVNWCVAMFGIYPSRG